MEEEFRQKMASTRTARTCRVLIGTALVSASVLAAPLTAGADPSGSPSSPPTIADVTTRLNQLAIANDKLTEAFDRATIELATAQRESVAAAKQASVAEIAFATAQHRLALSLASQYKGASFSHTAALLGSESGQSYLEKVQSLNFLAMHEQEIAAEAAVASAQAQQAEVTAARLVAAAAAKKASLANQRDHLSSEVAKQQQLLASLTAAQRAAYLAKGTPSSTQIATVSVSASPSSSKGAQAAVNAAMAQRGKPYVWGASGPDSFDCSGLTMYAWGQAGVNLPHDAAAQQGMGTPVNDPSQLQPGDLVFFGSPAYHVGMYIGNGMFVHAPTSGDVVKVTQLSVMSDYSGGRHFG